MRPSPPRLVTALLLIAGVALAACSPAASPTPGTATPSAGAVATASPETPRLTGELTIYAGRSEELVGPVIERFERETGVRVRVNYGSTSELAATILEEGDRSPADVYFAQDAGALGALAAERRLAILPDDTLQRVAAPFRSPDGTWVGVSGRARVAVYDTRVLSEADMPASILDFADPSWSGKLGWAPSNGSFQSFVTALRILRGDDAAREWLQRVKANEPKVYEGNSQALEAVAAGEIEVAFINHYYLLQALRERGGDLPVRNHFFTGDDPGALVNVAGVGVLSTARNAPAALAFVEFLLSEASQAYFAEETFEYPLVDGVPADDRLVPLDEIDAPDIDLSSLADLQGTLRLMQEAGVL